MRIAMLSYRSKTHVGGQGVYLRHLSRELVALGHTVEVFSGQPYPELDPGVTLTKVPSLDLYREPDPFRTPKLREFRDAIGMTEDVVMGLVSPFDLPENAIGYDVVKSQQLLHHFEPGGDDQHHADADIAAGRRDPRQRRHHQI